MVGVTYGMFRAALLNMTAVVPVELKILHFGQLFAAYRKRALFAESKTCNLRDRSC